jgi:hypothetical protein
LLELLLLLPPPLELFFPQESAKETISESAKRLRIDVFIETSKKVKCIEYYTSSTVPK